MYCPKQYLDIRAFQPVNRLLVVYFSATGKTEEQAKKLSFVTGADTYRIEPRIPYSEKDLDWRDHGSRSYVEMHDPDSRPLISKKYAEVEGHDVIFIGFPIWWGQAPSVIRTFMETHDFYRKKVVLFATSGGSGIGNIPEKLKEYVGRGEIVDARVLTGNETEDELRTWAEKF